MMNIKTNNYSNDLKLRVVKMYNEKIHSMYNICKIFNISKSSAYNWVKLFHINNKLESKQKYIKITSMLRNNEIKNIITNYILLHVNFLYKDIIKIIFKKTKLKISKSTCFNIIHNIGFTKKVAKFKKFYGNQSKLDLKKCELMKQIKQINNNKIISIDEVSFDTNIIHNYGWSLKNTPIIKPLGATYKRLTMICAISNKKIIHYKIIKDSAKSDTFLDFIKNIPNVRNKYLFLDNACIHHSKIVIKYTQENNIKMLFSVPYSPEYNPIEIMFSKLKHSVIKQNCPWLLNLI
jgi:transposase